MSILTKQQVSDAEKSIQDFRGFQGVISNRIREIIGVICKCYGADISNMWWDYAGDQVAKGDGGSLSENWGDTINIVTHGIGSTTIDTSEWPEEICFIPRDWLMLSDDNIEKLTLDFIQGVRDNKKTVKAAREKRARNKLAKKSAQADVLAKLSVDDRKILGF